MAFPTIFKRLFQNEGTGQKLRKDIMPYPQYEICEFYFFRHPTLKPGFAPCTGGVITEADEKYPLAWEYLQTAEGQLLCKTEAEWQAMSTAVYYTNASGVDEGWNGVGGVPFYVIDTTAKTIRLPDTRGMYAEAAGLDGLTVGGVHADKLREIDGSFGGWNVYGASGPFVRDTYVGTAQGNAGAGYAKYSFKASRVVPTGSHSAPRAFGTLACVYLGS